MKKIIQFASLAVVCAVSTSCRTVQGYETMLQSWVGKSEAQLVTTWGAPASMETIGPGRQLFVYIKQHQVTVPGEAPNYTALGEDSEYNNFGDSLDETFDYYCRTTFTTQDDIIVNYSWEGDGCLIE